jgi:putative ABC transport system permease protein
VDEGQKGAVLDELADVPGVIAVEDYPLFVQDIRDYVQYWRQTSQLFLMFGLLLTLAVILNTVSASLHEQQSELSILRSLGTSQREIFTGVMLELLIMGGLGIFIGVPLGRELGFYLTHSYNTDFYGLVPGMRMISYWVGVFGMLLAVLLAAIPGLRSVQRIDLGQVSKSQSI